MIKTEDGGQRTEIRWSEVDPQITQIDADYKKGEKNIDPQIDAERMRKCIIE